MESIWCLVLCIPVVVSLYDNDTFPYKPSERQLLDYKLNNWFTEQWTQSTGDPAEIRETTGLNTDPFHNELLFDITHHMEGERIPERVTFAKGTGAFGYFEVTHDVSKYTYADVFNGVGKKTPLVARLSTSTQNMGGSDLAREFKGFSVKFYTKMGNLDIMFAQVPVTASTDPITIMTFLHSLKRNPQTGLFDFTAVYDLMTLHPSIMHTFFWLMSDFGLPKGYRRMDAFAIHTYEIVNKHGETHYVKFNLRCELGFLRLSTAEAAATQALDLDHFTRDLYDNIENHNFPAWRLEMDVMTKDDVQNSQYDPFDITALWQNGTFHTVQIGRLVLNRNVQNQFRDVELLAFNPRNLVAGIPGPVDWLFRTRASGYRNLASHRLGKNHNKIYINKPLYARTYNRDGKQPTNLNGGNTPNYYPNSFNGPVPYVDERRPKKRLIVYHSNSVDLERTWYFYNYVLNEAQRQRFVSNIVLSLLSVTSPVWQRVIHLFHLVDQDLGKRVNAGLKLLRAQVAAQRVAKAAIPELRTANVDIVHYKKHTHHEL